MPIALILPPETVRIDLGPASRTVGELASLISMAYALELRARHSGAKEARPHWLDDAVKEINKLIAELKLETVIEQTDPLGNILDRINARVLSRDTEQVLR